MTPAYRVECQLKGDVKAEYIFLHLFQILYNVSSCNEKKGYDTHMSFKDLDKESDEWKTHD